MENNNHLWFIIAFCIIFTSILMVVVFWYLLKIAEELIKNGKRKVSTIIRKRKTKNISKRWLGEPNVHRKRTNSRKKANHS